MLRSQVFYLIRRFDPELAETFVRRCPNVSDIPELNAFLRLALAQHEADTCRARQYLDDTMEFDAWSEYFIAYVLPVFQQLRFPTLTAPEQVDYTGMAERVRHAV